ncbi:hypothetical protein Rwratislav_36289, partial [Rhodococcus wratislaviensis IFP 2016]
MLLLPILLERLITGLIPLGVEGDGDCLLEPVPFGRIPSRLETTSVQRVVDGGDRLDLLEPVGLRNIPRRVPVIGRGRSEEQTWV